MLKIDWWLCLKNNDFKPFPNFEAKKWILIFYVDLLGWTLLGSGVRAINPKYMQNIRYFFHIHIVLSDAAVQVSSFLHKIVR